MGSLLRWSWLLGLALIFPADLPAGGFLRSQPQVRRRNGSGPLYTSADTTLQLSPMSAAPSLQPLAAGTSLRLLRCWKSSDGQNWFQVQTLLGESQRGWIRA